MILIDYYGMGQNIGNKDISEEDKNTMEEIRPALEKSDWTLYILEY